MAEASGTVAAHERRPCRAPSRKLPARCRGISFATTRTRGRLTRAPTPIYKHAPAALPLRIIPKPTNTSRPDPTRRDSNRPKKAAAGLHGSGRGFACEARPRSDSFRVKRGGASAEQEGLEMDAFYSTSSAAYGAAPGAGWGYESLKNFRQITPAVQTHLKLVRLPDSALLLSRSSEIFPSPDFCLFLSSCQGLRAGFVSLYHRVISRAVRGGMRLRIRALSWFRGVNLTVILGNFDGNLVLIGLSLLRKRQVCSSVPGWLAPPGSFSAPDRLDDPVYRCRFDLSR